MKKIEEIPGAVEKVRNYKLKGKKIVLAGGCFDILHIGHISFLKESKKAGDILVLLLESDKSIRFLKGINRPINPQINRAVVLSAIEFVDLVVLLPDIFKTPDYGKLVRQIKPDIITVTHDDPNVDIKKMHAEESGGVVKIVLKKIPEHSTTRILDYF